MNICSRHLLTINRLVFTVQPSSRPPVVDFSKFDLGEENIFPLAPCGIHRIFSKGQMGISVRIRHLERSKWLNGSYCALERLCFLWLDCARFCPEASPFCSSNTNYYFLPLILIFVEWMLMKNSVYRLRMTHALDTSNTVCNHSGGQTHESSVTWKSNKLTQSPLNNWTSSWILCFKRRSNWMLPFLLRRRRWTSL